MLRCQHGEDIKEKKVILEPSSDTILVISLNLYLKTVNAGDTTS